VESSPSKADHHLNVHNGDTLNQTIDTPRSYRKRQQQRPKIENALYIQMDGSRHDPGNTLRIVHQMSKEGSP
jgi:predicted TIM-barrel fold metal-dependent hydrolase